jgi:uncharacterized membrane protein HdeD (DUF308 family)
MIGAMAIAALLKFAEWEDWVALVVGAAVGASPWIFGFSNNQNAAFEFAGLGIIVVLSSISEIWASLSHPAGLQT